MADFDVLSPNYLNAKQRWPQAPMLAKCYESLRACYESNAFGLVEFVKSFIESACVTILTEFHQPLPSSTPSTTELLVAALKPLGLQNTKGASKLSKVLSGFNKLADALTEMRNEHGTVAHGKDAFLDAITADHARAFLHVGDAILGLLLNALEGKEPDLIVTREPYERFEHHNERIDRAVFIKARVDEDEGRPLFVLAVATGPMNEAIEIRVEPSRLLYGIDRLAYVEVLRTAAEAIHEEEDEVSITVPTDFEYEHTPPEPSSPLIKRLPSYSGILAPLRSGLEGFLVSEGLDPTLAAPDGASLSDSLLATAEQHIGLDWRQREPLQARLKVACRRVMVNFGINSEMAEGIAERLVAWMRIQALDASEISTVA